MSMTVEQAKSELMQIYGALSPDKQRAIDTLVKIEPCEDAISRQTILDGIEELKKSPWATDNRGNGFEYLIAEALDVVADLCVKQAPSINPQDSKTGHWIDDEFGSKCSCCGIHTHLDKFDRPMKFKHCSMCGARMESENKE